MNSSNKHAACAVLGAAVLFAAIALAGCNAGDDGPTAAEQLAEDINKISAGSAEVNGATVTLAGRFVEIASGLTVPAGVTLDVTANGAALGLRNAALTVNGRVDAGPQSIRLEDNANEGTIKGSGTIQLKGKGNLLRANGNTNVANRKLTLDGVTLAGVLDNDEPLVAVNNGGEFVMKSGKIMGNTYTSGGEPRGGGMTIRNGGVFTMQGGEISGNTAQGGERAKGGGVLVAGGGMFTMQGGTISGNTAEGDIGSEGGGVFVSGGMFIMEGGVISDNRVNSGGGVAIHDDGTFTMQGGTISGNTAEGDIGGGVRVIVGTFTMEGGAISGNRARSAGGVAIYNGMLTMEGGTIYGNTGSLPVGTDPSLANIAEDANAALGVSSQATAKWGTGGQYTKNGVSQTGGSDIGNTDDTLIAVK
jgi:hypothetical protein